LRHAIDPILAPPQLSAGPLMSSAERRAPPGWLAMSDRNAVPRDLLRVSPIDQTAHKHPCRLVRQPRNERLDLGRRYGGDCPIVGNESRRLPDFRAGRSLSAGGEAFSIAVAPLAERRVNRRFGISDGGGESDGKLGHWCPRIPKNTLQRLLFSVLRTVRLRPREFRSA